MSRPFRFGLILPTRGATREQVVGLARRAEDEGYAVVLGTDHLGVLAALPLLQTAAETTRLRVGTLVLNNDLRHPVVLAHELAAVDAMTEGRLEIGIGAGWARDEYDRAGVPFDPPGQRIARMRAAVSMLKQAFAEGRIGRAADEAYSAVAFEEVPRSTQRPHPPFLIGGGGRQMLSYAAREAQIVGLDPRALPHGGHDDADVTEARFDEKIGWIREAAGDRLSSVDINVIIFGVAPDFRPGADGASLAPGLSRDEIAGSPHYLVGSAETMVEQLVDRRERWGINYIAVRRPDQMDLLAPIVARLAGK